MKKILVACEKSQAVTIAFRERGHFAYSCDIEPCNGGHPEWHFQQDVIPLLSRKWDCIIAFPPCTHLSTAGACNWPQKQADGRQQAAIDFFMQFINAPCDYIAVENPQGVMNTKLRKPDQVLNPFNFGDPYRKRTCLWLKGLPPLWHTDQDGLFGEKKTCIGPPPPVYIQQGGKKKGKARHFCDSLAGNKKRAEIRSKTFPGIARAMAEQWGDFLCQK